MGSVDDVLRPLGDMLAAEDYHLASTTLDDGSLRLTVTAGPGACSYCLIPKTTFAAIAQDHLDRAGMAPEIPIEVVYPED
ncbi:MAG: hypothetical protein M0Z30_06995 [Actinomycetota bacterium]|nr:hypothetical protein [Actinomycetota bacterium]